MQSALVSTMVDVGTVQCIYIYFCQLFQTLMNKCDFLYETNNIEQTDCVLMKFNSSRQGRQIRSFYTFKKSRHCAKIIYLLQ